MEGAATPRQREDAGGSAHHSQTATFWRAAPRFTRFGSVVDAASFAPLPGSWTLCLADVVGSTAAIAAGRYKAVNTAGAAVISAVSNALGTLDFPYLFAGDGAAFAVAPAEAPAAIQALAATASWVRRELNLAVRAGIVPVDQVRTEGYDVRIGRFAASEDAAYAMFAGGGLGWADTALKTGALPGIPSHPDAQPDLSGLSCRFQDLASKHGVILSILVRPCREGDPRFAKLLDTVLSQLSGGPDAGRPLPVFTFKGGLAPRAIALNARLGRRLGEWRSVGIVRTVLHSVAISALLGTGARLGGFSARRYLEQVVANTDSRKYGDGLMMTADCSRDTAEAVEAALAAAERDGIVSFGLHHQTSATVTCVVPSAMAANHVHFIDGAAGGYAMAANQLKSRLASSPAV